MIEILLVDDEAKSRSTLRRLLEKYIPEVEVCGEAANANEGERLIRELQPDLVLLDVEMPAESGFDLLRRFEKPEFEVVFCTAHDHYAIPAIRCAAIDYLLKPIKLTELQAAIEKARSFRQENVARQGQFETLLRRIHTPEKKQKIAVPDLKGIDFVEVSQLLYLKADNNYTILHLQSGKTMTSSRTLKDYDEMLKGEEFFRVSKSDLINLRYVARYVKGSGGTLILEDGTEIEVSRRRKEELLQQLMDR